MADDADLLLEGNRWARAVALAVLAVEELGKSFLCAHAVKHADEFRDSEWQDFWEDFRTHESKILAHNEILVELVGDDISRIIERTAVKSTSETKLAAIYVDIYGGDVAEPIDMFTNQSRKVVDTLTGLVRRLESLGSITWAKP